MHIHAGLDELNTLRFVGCDFLRIWGEKCETLYLGKRATSQEMNQEIGMSDFRLFLEHPRKGVGSNFFGWGPKE